jgi:hypothetical protein
MQEVDSLSTCPQRRRLPQLRHYIVPNFGSTHLVSSLSTALYIRTSLGLLQSSAS